MQIRGIDSDEKPTLAAIDVDDRKTKDGLLHVDRQRGAGAEGANSTGKIACVLLDGSRTGRRDGPYIQKPCELLRRCLEIAVDENEERVLPAGIARNVSMKVRQIRFAFSDSPV